MEKIGPKHIIEGSTFEDTQINVDDKGFKDCKFINVTLIYGGTGPVTFNGCAFNNVTWGLEGAASATIEFLTALHSSGIFMPLVYQIIGHITGGQKIPGKPE